MFNMIDIFYFCLKFLGKILFYILAAKILQPDEFIAFVALGVIVDLYVGLCNPVSQIILAKNEHQENNHNLYWQIVILEIGLYFFFLIFFSFYMLSFYSIEYTLLVICWTLANLNNQLQYRHTLITESFNRAQKFILIYEVVPLLLASFIFLWTERFVLGITGYIVFVTALSLTWTRPKYNFDSVSTRFIFKEARKYYIYAFLMTSYATVMRFILVTFYTSDANLAEHLVYSKIATLISSLIAGYVDGQIVANIEKYNNQSEIISLLKKVISSIILTTLILFCVIQLLPYLSKLDLNSLPKNPNQRIFLLTAFMSIALSTFSMLSTVVDVTMNIGYLLGRLIVLLTLGVLLALVCASLETYLLWIAMCISVLTVIDAMRVYKRYV